MSAICLPGAEYSFWRSNKFLFLVAWSRGLHFWKESKINSRCHWGCEVSRWVLSQQRKMQIYWWLFNNSEIDLWLWQFWAWLFGHKVPFTLQEHVKTTQTDKTRFFFAKKRWTWYPTNNCSLMSHSNQPNTERKNGVWTTSRLLEMCIVPHVEMKSVFTFQPVKRLVSTTVKSVKPAATFWIFLLRTKNQQLCCLVVMNTLLCKRDESRLRKTVSIFEGIPPPITTKHMRTWTKKGQNESKYGIYVFISYCLMIWAA